MTAGTATAEGTSNSNWLGTLGKIFYVFVVLVVAFVLYKGLYRPDDPSNNLWWILGTGWLLLGCLGFVLFILSANYRRFGFLVLLSLVLTIVISAFIQGQLTGNPRIVRAIQNSALLTFLLGGFVESVLWSIVLGVVGTLSLIGLPLVVIAYAASVYVLALHAVDGVSRWDAMRYVATLILGINLPFMVVENGQALITKKAGKIAGVGGPGKLIVKHGNVVVLERGGKITRVVNAGVTKLKPMEKIRNVFALSPKPNVGEVEHVLTKDRIPLTIRLGIMVQIEPASEADKRPESHVAPGGEALTKKLDDGLYQVYEGTIRKAALMSQATSFARRDIKKCEEQTCQDVEETAWQKVAGDLPDDQLRDHIMSHRFDELFELAGSSNGEEPAVRVKKRKIYEIEQAILEQIKPTKINLFGVLVRGVDVKKIEFPEGAEKLLIERGWAPTVTSEAKARSAELEAQAIVTKARAEAQARILTGQGEAEARAAFFREVLRAMRREGMLRDEDMARALMGLIQTMVSVQDLEAFVKAATSLQRRLPGGPSEADADGVGEASGNGAGRED